MGDLNKKINKIKCKNSEINKSQYYWNQEREVKLIEKKNDIQNCGIQSEAKIQVKRKLQNWTRSNYNYYYKLNGKVDIDVHS